MEGRSLLHYQIVRLLGKGGMGEVYLARDTKLGREVALKLLPRNLAGDESRRQRFQREAQTIASLNHPNVVTVHAVEEVDGQPFLVMELVQGQTLDALIPAGGFPVGRFFELALPLSAALAAAHAQGITHRDLKPQNVMIDPQGQLKVLDFGLAKLVEETEQPVTNQTLTANQITREGTIVGTAAYMSPEQAEGKTVDVRSDVFSLGVLLYQMLTGRQAFQGETHMSTLTAVLRDDPAPVLEIRPGLPRQLARILRRCLEKTPDRRFESAKGVLYELEMLREEMASGEFERPAAAPTAAPAAGQATPAAARRLDRGWITAAVLVVVLAMVGLMQLKPDRPAGESDPVASSQETAVPASPTIVVFPFENLGAPEDAYFAAGVTEEIITSLTGVEGLKVVSRSSARNYDRTGKTMQQIADDLHADYVLEGTVRWQRDSQGASQVRVTPQLVRTASDEQVWATRYDRAMEEIFKVQSDIAGEVVRNLGVTLAVTTNSPQADTPTRDMTAYHAYLRAREILDNTRFELSSWDLAIDLLEKATVRDPEFHEAWVSLAKANSGLCHFNWDRSDARLARAKAAADRAMALKPDDAFSHFAQGTYLYWGLKDYEGALAALRKADQRRPNDPEILETMAYVLRRQEKYAEAADILIQISESSPRDPALSSHITETLAIIGRYEEADSWARRSMELGPDQPQNFLFGAWSAIQGGRPDRARRYIADIPPFTDPEVQHNLFRIYFMLREYNTSLQLTESLPTTFETQYQTVVRDLNRALIHQAMGRHDRAREEFELAEDALNLALERSPDAPNLVASRAIALAALGRGEEAVAEIRRTFQLYPVSKDPWILTWREFDLAHIQVLAGRPAEAVETLARLLQKPTDVISPWILENSPVFDSLRDREDYKELMRRIS
jgi:TolB-like protein/Flp pilus assembly protein TadD